ncbi:MAG: Crp/Fnr family transcriptional regulator [Bacteroidetes bacterium]|nr:MAG: Crp/Fnr family transcriptional regulator [Bacteroidota bacterium]
MEELIDLNFKGLLEDDLLHEMKDIALTKYFKEGEVIIRQGDRFKYLPLLIEGSMKILKESNDGNDILLYYLEAGDTCAMALNCCLTKHESNIVAIAETDGMALMVPMEKTDKWIVEYPGWRAFVFNSFNQRFDELLETIEDIAFKKLDERLWKYLTDKVKVTGSTTLHTSHMEIAYDLNSSRVVISRLLKKLENQGKLKIGRNKIEMIEF